ncbi:MAG: fatty acid desaturase family protein [Myxococcota bacterium]
MAAATTYVKATAWRDAITKQELGELLHQNQRSWVSIGFNWAVVFASFWMVARWPNPFTVILALFLIGARQLGFAVLMHEASHRTLLPDRRWNDRVGNWLCAYPVFSDLRPYRPYHVQHHARTGTVDDPDLGLVKPFPITAQSLRRKFWRDLSGQTGLKFFKAGVSRTFGRYREDADARRAAQGVLVTNAVLLGILTLAGHPWLYLLWVGAWFTTNTLVTRIRAIAEHALTPDREEPFGRTRTTIARWWERLFIAPNRVNFHLEHHLVMTVPHYHLPRMHRLLKERGMLDDSPVDVGYWSVLKRAASRRDEPTTTDDRSDDPLPQPVRYPPF